MTEFNASMRSPSPQTPTDDGEPRLAPDAPEAAKFKALLDLVRPAARPRAMYGVAYVDRRNEESVTVDGVTYRSRVLARDLEACAACFPTSPPAAPSWTR